MKTKIVIVDDHVLIAKAISSIIENFEGFDVEYVCENGLELQKSINKNSPPDIVLLDISMPVMDGFETAIWLKECFPSVKVMALSMQDDEQSLIKMIKNGAKGYMLKNIHPKELHHALTKLMEDGSFFPNWATSKVMTSITENTINTSSKINLSEREQEFLTFAATEMNYKQIADIMCCSPRTVENYRDSLCEKLEIKTRVGLAVYAIKNGYSTD
ncbi:MAG: response regulator transcription factor [Flavobacteriales bacterium]